MIATPAAQRTQQLEITSPRPRVTTQSVIAARGLEKVYGSGASRIAALAGVSLTVNAGEWVSLVRVP